MSHVVLAAAAVRDRVDRRRCPAGHLAANGGVLANQTVPYDLAHATSAESARADETPCLKIIAYRLLQRTTN